MRKKPMLQAENRVWRTYRGGHQLNRFIGHSERGDSCFPEDWISSFVEAKNKNYTPGEGISRVYINGREIPITEAVSPEDFGPNRTDSGVLIKFLDTSERLGIQVHPVPEFSRRHFGTNYGKTECWHILATEGDAAVYIGFKENISREKWKDLFVRQDIAGMTAALHRFPVKAGDTILVHAGTPHAIGAGCFLLEIQEPSDYTMRAEKTTADGQLLTPMQIHYGLGEETLLDCFIYEGLSESLAREKHFLSPVHENGITSLVSYQDTPCFAMKKIQSGGKVTPQSFVSVIVTESGTVRMGDRCMSVNRGEKWFVPYGTGSITVICGEIIVCYPPQERNTTC